MRYRILIVSIFLLAACEQAEHPNERDIAAAEHLNGVEMTPVERELMLDDIREQRQAYDTLHEFDLPNELRPALLFEPGYRLENANAVPVFSKTGNVARPENDADIAFMSVAELGALLRQGDITSEELTRIYVDRIRRYDDQLHAVITLTEELALQQARRADADFAAGVDRGPLQGIPYGLKDLFAVAGYPTTWGAMPYKDQTIEQTATVAKRLEDAGAVLLAKTSVGALAWGDVWFGGKTRTPWNTEEGSSGSSAGSASGVAAGLFPFAIGTETWGSIVSPSIQNGVTGLRPTFGAVSREGAMALSWSMDKVGPICRYAEDCAMVFDAIRGPDGADLTVKQAGFAYDAGKSIGNLRIAYLEKDFSADYEGKANDELVLQALRDAGVEMNAVALPDIPAEALSFILSAEAAAAFDTLTRSGRDDLMVRQERFAWPNVFRAARFIPAVEYIQANRLRMQLVASVEDMLEDYDVLLAPCFGGNQLLVTNLTGHPSMVISNGQDANGIPTGTCLIGKPFGEAALVTAARDIQAMLDFHVRRPPGFGG